MATILLGAIEVSDKVITHQKSSITEVAGASDTLNTDKSGHVFYYTSASAIAVTLAADAEVGTSILCIAGNTGQLQFSAAGSGSIVNKNSHVNSEGTQYDQCLLQVVQNSGGSAAVWHLSGDTGL